MLKLLTFAFPLLIKGRSKVSAKKLAGLLAIYALAFAGLFCILAALFVWILKAYSLEAAFLAIGAILLFAALILLMSSRKARQEVKQSVMPETLDSDYLAAYLPESVIQDPIVQKFLNEISDKPLSSTAAALTLGLLISREIFD